MCDGTSSVYRVSTEFRHTELRAGIVEQSMGFVVLARQATKAAGTVSMELIPGLLKSLKMPSPDIFFYFRVFRMLCGINRNTAG